MAYTDAGYVGCWAIGVEEGELEKDARWSAMAPWSLARPWLFRPIGDACHCRCGDDVRLRDTDSLA